MPPFFFSVSPLRGAKPFIKFFITESFINSLIIYLYIKITERIDEGKGKEVQEIENGIKRAIASIRTNTAFRVSLSLSMLVLALYVQWIL